MAKKTLYFDTVCGYTVAAVTENGKLTQFDYEKRGVSPAVGNIYKGRVETVLAGMRAAFIDCGLEKNCYLSADDVIADGAKYDCDAAANGEPPPLREGEEICVQLLKPPAGAKGARVTTRLSYVGKSVIYFPQTEFTGVSRKISDGELRKNMLYCASRLKRDGEGLIMRTAAPYAKRGLLEKELDYLRNLHGGVMRAAENAECGALLYTDAALHVRLLRDTLIDGIEKIYVGNEKLEKLISDIVSLYPPASRKPVVRYRTNKDMLDDAGIAAQLAALASPRVPLNNGANLVIERTEALTVIDVNTGKFTGDDSLEHTVYYTDVLAAREIARQVKLRNIGGIVVVDFIDVSDPAHRKAVTEELERELKKDGAKCTVAPMSQFGLVEFTRKRSGGAKLSALLKPCPECRGAGYIKSDAFLLFNARAKILSLAEQGNKIIRADMNAELYGKLTRRREYIEELQAQCPDVSVYVVAHKSFDRERITYRCEGEAGFTFPPPSTKLF